MANTDISLTSVSNTQLNAVRVMLLFLFVIVIYVVIFCGHRKVGQVFQRYKYHGDPQRKIYIPLSEEHRELHRLENHLKTFTDLENIARSKGLGENPDVAIAGLQKEGTGLP